MPDHPDLRSASNRDRALGVFFGLLALVGPACDRPSRIDSKPVDLTPPPRQQALPAAPAAEPRAGVRDAMAAVACERDSKFPEVLEVPEASAAAEIELTPGERELLVVSDSGRKGAAVLWNVATGAVRKTALAFDSGASDDLEGIAWLREASGAHLYTLTSSGAVRRFSPDGAGGLKRDRDAYALGAPPAACEKLGAINCGRNYEGLCLRPKSAPPGRCAGYAASRAQPKLYCLVFDGDRLVADAIKSPIDLALPRDALSDCAFGAEGGPAHATLVVTTNVHGGSASYVVDEASGELTPLDVPGTLNNEAIAIDRTGALYQMMDTNSALSPGFRHICRGW
jgi:hypothetical protein